MMQTAALRALIVDDEPAARRKIARFLQEHDDVEIAGEAQNGRDAVERILNDKPDLVFLDIQMPDMNGFDVVEAIAQGDDVPSIVFVTAYDQYAVRAFEVNALDYLLKPFDRDRFERALERCKKSLLEARPAPESLLNLLETLRPEARYARRLLVPNEGRSLFVNVREIVRLESDKNNVVVHTARGTYVLRATLESLVDRLDPEQFARIHRSHVVNIDAIKEIHPWFHGDYRVLLNDATTLTWSRRYAAKRPDLIK